MSIIVYEHDVIIRKIMPLNIKDVPMLHHLMEKDRRQKLLLNRSIERISLTAEHLRVLWINGNIVGTIGLMPYGDIVEIFMWWVDPQHRGHGNSSVLYKHAIKEAKERGFKKVFLCTTSNRIAEYLLIKDFQECGKDSVPSEKWVKYPADRKTRIFIAHM